MLLYRSSRLGKLENIEPEQLKGATIELWEKDGLSGDDKCASWTGDFSVAKTYDVSNTASHISKIQLIVTR